MTNLILGDSHLILKTLAADSIDAVVTDPPYGLSFMNKHWDHDVPSVELWREVLRVLKPGGHVLSFGGTRTYHRMVVNIEDAGFEIRDQIQWIYGSGFPKSHNLNGEWQGWGTALKPANEPIVLARKPLIGTVAENVQTFGTGALNIDASRIGSDGGKPLVIETLDYQDKTNKNGSAKFRTKNVIHDDTVRGRWPANVLFDEEAAAMLDAQSGILRSGELKGYNIPGASSNGHLIGKASRIVEKSTASSGGASRFFYVAKASKRERNAGLGDLPLREAGIKNDSGRGFSESDPNKKIMMQNHHPTVKPIKLMEYLVRLITPPGGTVLDPFMGSGTIGIAAKNLGFGFVGIERSEEYFEIAKRRI